MSELPERCRSKRVDLEKAGWPCPELGQAADTIERLERELAEAKASLDPNDEHGGHCAQAIRILFRMMGWELRREWDAGTGRNSYPNIVDALVVAERRMDRVKARHERELAAAREDTERLTWLDDEQPLIVVCHDGDTFIGGERVRSGSGIREAIDSLRAARRAEDAS